MSYYYSSVVARSDKEKIINQGVLTNPPDFKISIDKYTWAVHSNKLARSAFFKKLSESGFKESQSKSVTLHDDDPDYIARLILWFYYESYPLDDNERRDWTPTVTEMMAAGAQQNGNPLTNTQPAPQLGYYHHKRETMKPHFAMYLIADKYDIPALRLHVLVELKKTVSSVPADLWNVVAFKQSLGEQSINGDDVQAFIDQEFSERTYHYIDDGRFEEYVKKRPELAWKLVKKLSEEKKNRQRMY